VGQFLEETGFTLGAEDESPFEMRLLHFRRTFVEKMFAIHAKVEAFKTAGQPLGGYARHYYDLFCLAERPEVLAMLRSDEYAAIKADYDRISREHFSKSYVPLPGTGSGDTIRNSVGPMSGRAAHAGRPVVSTVDSAGCDRLGFLLDHSSPEILWIADGVTPIG
jgi:hypothetical protein